MVQLLNNGVTHSVSESASGSKFTIGGGRIIPWKKKAEKSMEISDEQRAKFDELLVRCRMMHLARF